MQLEQLCRKYELSGETAEFMRQYGYAESQESFVWPLPELSGGRLEERCFQLGLQDDAEQIREALGRAGENEELCHLFYYLHFYWYKFDNALIYGYKLPDFTAAVPQEEADILHLALAISGCGAVEKKFASLNIPQSYAAAALQRIAEDAALYSLQNNRRGYPAGGHHWMRFFVEGRLFRIGRFEYMIEPEIMKFTPQVFKERSGERIIALCRNGWQLNKEGFQLWRDIPEEPYCTAEFKEDDSAYYGIVVDPRGFAAVDKQIELKKSEFEPLWDGSGLVLDMHIPPGGNMRPELCLDSLTEALKFFPAFLKEPVKAFVSFSWIFNPDFCDVMPESNISKFMQELYLTPFAGSSLSGLSFVFGKEDQDWSNYPAGNSLQRAFHQLRKSGRRLKTGGMFIEAAGIKAFGSSFYRKNYPALVD